MPSASTVCFSVELQRRRDAGGSPHRAEHRGRMEARLVHGLRHHEAEPAQHLDADRDAAQRRRAVRIVPLAGRQHRRNDNRAGMHRPALESVVEILAVRGRAVDQRGAGRAQRARMADRGARPVVVAAGERRLDVVLVARRDAQADHVDREIDAFLAHGRRHVERRDALGELLGDGNFGSALMCCAAARRRRSRACG